MVEDGHSLAEQAVYEVLWKTSTPMSWLDATPTGRSVSDIIVWLKLPG